MDIGARIIELRQRMGITTNKLANLCGLSQSFVRAVECGEKGITVENLSLICDALHISMQDFFEVSQTEEMDANELYMQLAKLTAGQKSALAAFLKTLNP